MKRDQPSMKTSTRQDAILAELRARPAARLGDLAAAFGVSKETIRRDITALSARGEVARTYGGALPSSLDFEPSLHERSRLNPEGRQLMAVAACALVAEARVLMIDAGSSVLHVCERLAASVPSGRGTALTVVTNSMKNAMVLADNPAIRVVVCPGTYDAGEMAAHGPLTIEFLRGFRAEALVTSAGGILPAGVMDANSDAAAIKRAMLGQAARTILLADRHKFGHAQFETVCALADLDDLVTDGATPADIAAGLEAGGVVTHVVAAG
jgi:DeoR/GlpR family transcriptional regulator of sugar metabolism